MNMTKYPMIGFKKAFVKDRSGYPRPCVVVLEILGDVRGQMHTSWCPDANGGLRRYSDWNTKLRTNKARVLEILGIRQMGFGPLLSARRYDTAHSAHLIGRQFVFGFSDRSRIPDSLRPFYRVGEVLTVHDFDRSHHTCKPGIHFFLDPEQAMHYTDF